MDACQDSGKRFHFLLKLVQIQTNIQIGPNHELQIATELNIAFFDSLF